MVFQAQEELSLSNWCGGGGPELLKSRLYVWTTPRLSSLMVTPGSMGESRRATRRATLSAVYDDAGIAGSL